MEDPILNKAATNYRELFNISPERASELIAGENLIIRPGFTILSKVASTVLNKAKTINEQLFLAIHLREAISDIIEQLQIDPRILITEEIGEVNLVSHMIEDNEDEDPDTNLDSQIDE